MPIEIDLVVRVVVNGCLRRQVSVNFIEASSSFAEFEIARSGHKSYMYVRILGLDSNFPHSQANELCLTISITSLFTNSSSQLLNMPTMKRALLIASPFGGLRGPINDVKTMEAILSQQGFEVLSCCDVKATRQGIMDAWETIIKVSQAGDVVVIYYSGHGGIVEDDSSEPSVAEEGDLTQQQSWRYQFLVPMDFSDPTAADGASSFNGILDVELEDLLRRTTDRTENVTTIFDCCHSGRMARDPSHTGAVPRNLPKIRFPKLQFASVSQKVERLRETNGDLAKTYLHNEGNRHAVRIAAAGALETAWEDGDHDQRAGVMTRELARALREAWEVNDGANQISWQNMSLRVSELVNVNFPRQNPYVEGPQRRMLFSLDESETNAVVLHPDGQHGILKAGRISSVREGNVYALMPLLVGSERIREETKIGEATVTEVRALESIATLSILPNRGPIPARGVMAFLVKESLLELPVGHPEGPQELLDAIDGSKYLCRREVHGDVQDTDLLATFRLDEGSLVLTDNQGRLLLSEQVSDEDPYTWKKASDTLVKQAEQLAKANQLLSLNPKREEKLEHRLTLDFGTMKNQERQHSIVLDGKGEVFENESICISLTNNGTKTVHVSAFDINVSGKIALISSFELDSARAYHIGAGQFRERPQGDGLALGWPKGISRAQPVPESLVLVLTDSRVDLSVLASGSRAEGKGEAGPSALERLSYWLATGEQRDVAVERVRVPQRFDLLHVPFQMKARENTEISAALSGSFSGGQDGADNSSC